MAKNRDLTYEAQLKAFLTPKLRRMSLMWFARNIALASARVSRGFYLCASCKKIHGRKSVQVDHIDPIMNPMKTGLEIDWNLYVRSLFCTPISLQVLCTVCHESKTMLENQLRAIVKNDVQTK